MLWTAMILLYLKAFEDKHPIRMTSYAIASGIMAGMLSLSWEGHGLATAIISLWMWFRVFRGKIETRDVLVYWAWYICLMSISLSLTHAYRNWALPYAFLAIMAPTATSITLLLWFVSRKMRRFDRFSKGAIISVIGWIGAISLLLLVISLKNAYIGETFRSILDNFLTPLGRSRLMRSVIELTGISGESFVRRYSVILLLASASSTVLAYRFFSGEPVNFPLAVIGFEAVLCGTLVSLFLHSRKISDTVYIISTLAGLTMIFTAYLIYKKDEEMSSEYDERERYFPILIWFFIGLFTTRGAGRYGFFLDPLIALMCSFILIESLRFIAQRRTGLISELGMIGILIASELYAGIRLSLWNGLFQWTLLPLTALISTFALVYGLSQIKISNYRRACYLTIVLILILFIGSDTFHRGFIRSNVEVTRQRFMPIFRETQRSLAEIGSGPLGEGSVVAAWWDYGSVLNWFAKCTTIVDEDHYIPYWIFLIARHVFSAASPKEALEFLYTHRATHLMITTREILALTGITYTGSDTSFDRLASVYSLIPIGTRKMGGSNEVTDFAIRGFTSTDEMELEGERFPPGSWRIRKISISRDKNNNSWSAVIHGQVNGRSFSKPPREFQFKENRIQNENGLPGLIAVFPSEAGGILQAFYVSEKAKHLLAVRLYLFKEKIPGFKLIYDTNTSVRCDRNGIRIWKLDYPPDIREKNEYLARDFPLGEKKLRKAWRHGDFIKEDLR
ncbi:hypothetical protein J7M22_01125 [Candidatus Poribacteria bacterium]|nr:hypothetical protein [Candidatus Poribacteria bacterium]